MPALSQLDPTAQTKPAAHVEGDLTAADGPFQASGDLVVDRNIIKAEVRCGGNVSVGGDVAGATVVCAGELQAPGGAIVGGRIAVGRSIACRVLGSLDGTPTELVIGVDEQWLDDCDARVSRIRQVLGKARDFRARLERMQQTAKKLSAAQKEQMTEMLFRTVEGEKKAESQIAEMNAALDRADSDIPECVISERVFSNVTIGFPGARVTIGSPLDGPIMLSAERVGERLRVLATDLSTGVSREMIAAPAIDRAKAIQHQIRTIQ